MECSCRCVRRGRAPWANTRSSPASTRDPTPALDTVPHTAACTHVLSGWRAHAASRVGRADMWGRGVLGTEEGAEQEGVEPTEGRGPSSQLLGDVGRPRAEGIGREEEEDAEEPLAPCPHQPRGVSPMHTRAAKKAPATSLAYVGQAVADRAAAPTASSSAASTPRHVATASSSSAAMVPHGPAGPEPGLQALDRAGVRGGPWEPADAVVGVEVWPVSIRLLPPLPPRDPAALLHGRLLVLELASAGTVPR